MDKTKPILLIIKVNNLDGTITFQKLD